MKESRQQLSISSWLRTKSQATSGRNASPFHQTIERLHAKYRGFRRMLRYLTLDPAVARPAVGGPRPVHFRPLCLFNPAVGTRRSFAAPFRSDPSIERGGISATG